MGEITEAQYKTIKECDRQFLKNSEIMAKWKTNYPDQFIVFDGINNYFEYASQKKKILFILKEYNNTSSYIETQSFLLGTEPHLKYILERDGNNENKTYSPIAKWTDIILNKNDSDDYNKLDSRIKLLEKVAIMNLSKVPGLSNTNKTNNQYQSIANKNILLLEEQFNNINPNIVFICSSNTEDHKIINKFTACESLNPVKDACYQTESEKFCFFVRKGEKRTFIYTHHPAHPNRNFNKSFERELLNFIKSVE